ncbi:hypothetical protein GCM10009535_05220 [Streptomyces thermocarboxydovorans]|uniref:ABC3 transporter permease C-terminal domain-containing protein n=1 Tax=Streptomyces thermocarboxydovorans TaxID=59298 RepID=A0ABP3SC28_9ACTN
MGTRFAFAGGREGWVRAVLTAVGVGLGVALLLITTAVPNALDERHRREEARLDYTYGESELKKADDTLVIADLDTEFQGRDVRGRLMEPGMPSCRDGDVFRVSGGEYDTDTPALSKPGRKLYLEPSAVTGTKAPDLVWTVPAGLKQAESAEDPTGMRRGGFLMTPGALTEDVAKALRHELYIAVDHSVPDAREYVRNTAAHLDPLAEPMNWQATERSERFDSIRTGLFVGAAAVLVLIGASLLVSQLEQLRERRKLLSSLVAFGTRRRTLSLSVLWQTAIPIGLGLLLASLVGMTLGAVLLRMTATAVRIDWASVASMTGIGAGVVLVVTLLSLPPLLRMMRPDGLRTE